MKVFFSSNLFIFLTCLITTGLALGLPEEDYWEDPSIQKTANVNEAYNNGTGLLSDTGILTNETDPSQLNQSSTSTSSTLPDNSSITDNESGTGTSPSEAPTTEEEVTDDPTDATDTTDDENPTEITDEATSTSASSSKTEASNSTVVSDTTLSSSSEAPVDPNPSDIPPDPVIVTSTETVLPPLDPPVQGKVSTWAIASISIMISFAAIFTALYFLRGFLIRKRRDDQKRLLRGSISSEGFFYGDGSGTAHSDRFHDSI